MELSSDFVGTRLKEYSSPVTGRWTMNYAAAIGDTNNLYFDDERAGGIIAPPLFPVAVTWPAIERIADNIESDNFPREIIFTQVHFSEHLLVHRPVKPGDLLRIRGEIAAILPHRAGTQVVLRFDAEDEGAVPVFTEHIGAMMRGVACPDGGKGLERIPTAPRHPERPGFRYETVIPVDPLTPFLYDGCTNIHFPIHTSVQFAHQVGLPGIILQGTMTLALAVRDLVNREAGGDSRRVESVSCRFSGMVLPGSEIRVRLISAEHASGGTDLFFTVINSDGNRVLSDGHIRIKG